MQEKHHLNVQDPAEAPDSNPQQTENGPTKGHLQWKKSFGQAAIFTAAGYSNATQRMRDLRVRMLQTPPQQRSENDILLIDQVFTHVDVLRKLSRNLRWALCKHATVQVYSPGDRIMEQGQGVEGLYIVMDGDVEIKEAGRSTKREARFIRSDLQDNQKSYASLGGFAHDPSGIIARPRHWPFSVTAWTSAAVALITPEVWQAAWQEDGATTVDSMTAFLRQDPAMRALQQEDIDRLAAYMRIRRLQKDQVIYRQGSDTDELIFIRRGYVRFLRAVDVPRQDRTLQYMHWNLGQLDEQYKSSVLYPADVLSPRSQSPEACRDVDGLGPGPRSCRPTTSRSHGEGLQHSSGASTHRARLQGASSPSDWSCRSGSAGPQSGWFSGRQTPAVLSSEGNQLSIQSHRTSPSRRSTRQQPSKPCTAPAGPRHRTGHDVLHSQRPSTVAGTVVCAAASCDKLGSAAAAARLPRLSLAKEQSENAAKIWGGQVVSTPSKASSPSGQPDPGLLPPGMLPPAGHKRAFVDVCTLGPGQCFGELGPTTGKRMFSAVTDTTAEVWVLTRYDFQSRLGERLMTYLRENVHVEVSAVTNDDDIRARFSETLAWELYKKTLVRNVLNEYGAARAGRHLRT